MFVAGGVGVGGGEEHQLVAGIVEIGKRIELLAFRQGPDVHVRKLIQSHFVLGKRVFLVLLEDYGKAVAVTVEGVFVDIPESVGTACAEVKDDRDLLRLGGGLDGVGDFLLPLGLVCDYIALLECGLESADIGDLAELEGG